MFLSGSIGYTPRLLVSKKDNIGCIGQVLFNVCFKFDRVTDMTSFTYNKTPSARANNYLDVDENVSIRARAR